MTGLEIMTLTEAALELIAKIAGLVQAAQKGDVKAVEALKKLTESDGRFSAAVDEVRAHIDELFDK